MVITKRFMGLLWKCRGPVGGVKGDRPPQVVPLGRKKGWAVRVPNQVLNNDYCPRASMHCGPTYLGFVTFIHMGPPHPHQRRINIGTLQVIGTYGPFFFKKGPFI